MSVRQTPGGQPVEDSEGVAARLGMSVEWAHLHRGDHKCLDGRRYIASCLVTDPTCDDVARSYMAIADGGPHNAGYWAREECPDLCDCVTGPTLECYSDHAEDIRTKGSCDYCGGDQ